MIKATQLRVGMAIKMNDELYRVFYIMHVTPGKGRGMVQTKLKNLISGVIIDHRFRSEDFVERAILDQKEMEYLYNNDNDYFFMNTSTYEQIHLTNEMLADAVQYLIPNAKLQVEFHEGQPIGIELPQSVELKVIETSPGIKGATASQQKKPAKLETGLMTQVPSFIEEGETIRVSTVDGSYMERVSSKST